MYVHTRFHNFPSALRDHCTDICDIAVQADTVDYVISEKRETRYANSLF